MRESAKLTIHLGRHHPHEVLYLVLSVIVGSAYLLGVTPPGTLEKALPPAALTAWYVAVFLSGVVGLAGCWVPNIVTGLRLERAGMFIAAGASLLYSMALFTVTGVAALAAGAYVTAYGLASLVRARRIGRDLRRIERIPRDE